MRNSVRKYLEALNPRDRFNRDVSWHIISLGVLGFLGLANNIILKNSRGDFGLGIFSIVYAIYIIVSQLAVGGVHLSVLRNISYNQKNPLVCREIYSSGLALTALTSSIVAIGFYFLRNPIANLTQNPAEVSTGIVLVAPGLVFYSLNKVLLNILNGLRYMRSYAFFQSLRIVLLCGSIIVLVLTKYSAEIIPVSLTIAELILFFVMMAFVSFEFAPPVFSRDSFSWFGSHFSFSMKSVLSGVLFNINLRIDQIMLSHFFDAKVVGIYTFASFFVEGINEVAHAVKRNVDPIIGRFFSRGNIKAVNRIVYRVKKNFTPLLAAIFVAAIAGFPALAIFVGYTQSFRQSWLVLVILMVGVFISGRYRPFYWVLIQGGRPEMYTVVMVIVTVLNVTINYLLIPVLGVFGAAIATALVFIFQAYLIKLFSWKILKVRI